MNLFVAYLALIGIEAFLCVPGLATELEKSGIRARHSAQREVEKLYETESGPNGKAGPVAAPKVLESTVSANRSWTDVEGFSLYDYGKMIWFLYVDWMMEMAAQGSPDGAIRPRRWLQHRHSPEKWTIMAKERVDAFMRRKFRLHDLHFLEGRGRRRDQKILALIVMGFMIMASILIPTGFQFLTVLGGKSLLMAKMALIMSAISGLKKIATSNVGYGFYHTGSDSHHHDHLHHGFHEKVFQGSPQQGSHYPLGP